MSAWPGSTCPRVEDDSESDSPASEDSDVSRGLVVDVCFSTCFLCPLVIE